MPFLYDFNYSVTMESIDALIDSIKESGSNDIVIVIESDGGNPNCLKALDEFMEENKDIHISTIGIGRVASAAASLFMYGENRTLLKDSFLLLHEPTIPTLSNNINFTVLDQMRLELKDVHKVTFKKFFEKTSITPEVLKEKISQNSEWIIYSEEAEQLGIITKTKPLT